MSKVQSYDFVEYVASLPGLRKVSGIGHQECGERDGWLSYEQGLSDESQALLDTQDVGWRVASSTLRFGCPFLPVDVLSKQVQNLVFSCLSKKRNP
jgi:hypothetical protein